MNRPTRPNPSLRVAGMIALGTFSACAADVPAGLDGPETEAPSPVDEQTDALWFHRQKTGKQLFTRPFAGSNGRACSTCHDLADSTTLTPARVEARLEADPEDPLFDRLDADDPDAAVLTFEHLKKGLIRVVFSLPENMDVIDFDGNVITPPDRTIFVWRGVPSVANTAITAPYQLDGRAPTLQEQAQAAILSHSEGAPARASELDRLASFQKGIFSSGRARFVAELLDRGLTVEQIPIPEDYMVLSPAERRGKKLYEAACEGCHGGATTDRIVDREVHDFFFPELTPEGNVAFDIVPGVGPVPRRLSRPNVEILNTGYGVTTYFGQIGLQPAFNDSVELPKYRFRFYTDGTRTRQIVDLPPRPVTVSGDPLDPRPAVDANGAPIVGPNLIPQLFTTDPGNAVITGDPADFEAFDVPQLRGIARTPPYFHDNSHATLRDVVDSYSRFVLPAIPPLGMPDIHPPEQPGGFTESLSVSEKADLLAFLQRL